MWRVLFNLSRYVFSKREPESWRFSAVTLITTVVTVLFGFVFFFALIYLNIMPFFLKHPFVFYVPLFIFFSWFFFYGVKQFKKFVDELESEKNKSSR
ncbi:hypothetical protein EV690_2082 [Celerinatantimonas diazotrophica]|uniref:Uncharacterized protein n=1 Tax=Celerinatantimonas diazotrophica TaxID=412034 RepID=A0A4R1JLP3_9GAMM|nr:hypothetical protein EV690_2082 [Celerinatantimonas diazotrophica]CAG9296314.1 hypothetical protein CEDIAZO_01462 [Celerinatantimonas diazotrophica]